MVKIGAHIRFALAEAAAAALLRVAASAIVTAHQPRALQLEMAVNIWKDGKTAYLDFCNGRKGSRGSNAYGQWAWSISQIISDGPEVIKLTEDGTEHRPKDMQFLLPVRRHCGETTMSFALHLLAAGRDMHFSLIHDDMYIYPISSVPTKACNVR